MDYPEKIDWLRERLLQPLPGLKAQERMSSRSRPAMPSIPGNARPSAVLALLYPIEATLHLLLIKRVADGKAHGGQISFPGGKWEDSDADLAITALREAQEEVGVLPANVDILGSLSTLYIPVSNFQVSPFVGYSPARPEFIINPYEVDRVLEVRIDELLHPDTKATADIQSTFLNAVLRKVRGYKIKDTDIIWGATAMIIAELEMILEEIVQ